MISAREVDLKAVEKNRFWKIILQWMPASRTNYPLVLRGVWGLISLKKSNKKPPLQINGGSPLIIY